MGYIYCIENKINGKQYIGQTSLKYPNTRWSNHKGSIERKPEHPLYRAMNKYGIENFEFKILLKDIPNEQLNYYEILWIQKLNTRTPNGYNISIGGESLKGEDNPMFGKEPWNKGVPRDEDTKNKIRNTWNDDKREKYSKMFSGENNPMYGVKPSEEILEKIRSHWDDDKKRENILMQKNRKEVAMIDKNTNETIMTFISLGEASKWVRENTLFIKADYATINKVCKKINKTAYGFKWKYVEEV